MTAVSVHVQYVATEARRLPAAQLWAGMEESLRTDLFCPLAYDGRCHSFAAPPSSVKRNQLDGIVPLKLMSL